MSSGRVALLVAGIVLLVGALSLMMLGGGMMGISAVLKNDNPVFPPGDLRLRKADACALVSEPFDITWDDEYRSDGRGLGDLVTVRIRIEGQDPSKGVFVAVAEYQDAGRYLDGIQHYEVADSEGGSFDDPEIEYRLRPGSLSAPDPTVEASWEASSHGPGEQTLEWRPRMGRWVLVIMNEDGSAGIDVRATLGVDLPWLFWLGLAILAAGTAALVGGGIMVYVAARTPGARTRPASIHAGTTTDCPLSMRTAVYLPGAWNMQASPSSPARRRTV